MISQWILAIALVLVGLYLLRAQRSASQQAIVRLFIIIAIATGFVAVVFPNLTTLLASFLGIGRGTDLLLYALVVFVLFHIVHQYRRQRWQQKVTAELARALAIVRAEIEDVKKPSGN